MKYTILPNTNLKVSKLCLGTMTWGQQNTEAEAHEQLHFAIGKGINFIDCAEMYPVPANPNTQGKTETYIGNWLAKKKNREDLIIATKIAGPSRSMDHIRQPLDFSKKSLEEAIHKSLKRLQTEYIDLYQLHWPERNTNYFGQRDYTHKENEAWQDNFAEVLNNFEEFVKAGKIRHIGLSNETPFGVMRCIEEFRNGKIKIASVQNPYNLLNRKDEIGLSEILQRENISYLAYSPLGFGTLTGKYLDGKADEDSRINQFKQYTRYSSKPAFEATKKYFEIAKKHNLSFTHLALAFILQKKFVTAPIIGATSIEQLAENIESINVTLSKEILKEIDAIHNQIPNPAP
ncbi:MULTISPECIES: NADP(H)-dependent aldo-keto reductase [Aequorivita]|uniref:NADP(H)-dependent aldo-keto reductase n=1 Tax=Aequorivita iocasae TaxID=2803865 RepID=A0ABX7DUT5_9FLAO|nr:MULTISPECIES: NADP(H)-dependent aldo-keto reductase [Aequorivita]QQX77381.1 NADP(H)-dependent aldo-keto reductase [Aequorivita iocasae]UCA56870.1 NADP(H)-dependent aldo-keto reductase [Aequorivita sp. F7]